LVCTTRGISAEQQYVESLKLKSLLVATLNVGSSITTELMILGVLHLPVARTL